MGVVDIVSASAGSGKTYSMAYRYVRTLIQNPTLYRHILAVTFTNKATDELKERILRQLHDLAKGNQMDYEQRLLCDTEFDSATIRARAAEARSLILHDYNNFSVMTIDKFFQRVMRAFIKELDVDLSFNIELQTDSLLARAADRMLDELSNEEKAELRDWVLEFIGENIEEGESWDIKRSLTKLGTELFKEEYREAKIESGDKPLLRKLVKLARQRAEVAEAKYKGAAQEFVAIMDRNGLTESDFKGGSRSVAAYVQKAASGVIAPMTPAALNALEKGEWYTKTCPKKALIDSLAGELGRALQTIKDVYPEAVIAENTANILSGNHRDFALLADLRTQIDTICTEESILPIADVNDLIHRLIADNEAPFIYEKSGNRYAHFMIDEFQDTSTMQWRNFVPLLHNAVAQSEESPVMLVGDVKQSIYRWRGGDWSLLAHGARNEFEQVDTSSLLRNFRSRQKVVEFNNDLIEHAVAHIKGRIEESLGKAEESGYLKSELRKSLCKTTEEAYADYRQEPNDHSGGGCVSIQFYERKAEHHPVLERICELQDRGYRAGDIAILVRSNEDAKRVAKMLLDYKNLQQEEGKNYVFDVVTQEALEIGASSAVRFMTSCLGLAINPGDRICKATYLQFLGQPFEDSIEGSEAEFLGSLALMQPEEAFNEIVLRYPQCCATEEVPYVQAFHSQIINYCSRKIADTALLLKWWNESGYKESIALPGGADAITIATIHKAKGLSYKVVLLPFCDWSVLPLVNSTMWATPNAPISDKIRKFPTKYTKAMGASEFSHAYYIEQTLTAIDALNTLYVAITRPEEELHIMVAENCKESSVGHIFKSYVCNECGMDTDDIFTYGFPAQYASKELPEASPSTFDTYSPKGKLAIRYDHQRYDEESRGESLSPRDMGTLMHKVFESAATLADAERSIEELATTGEISHDDAALLRTNIGSAMESPEVREWFDGTWEEVYTEREIIAEGSFYRPDRVMTQGGQAVVVDYKFGLGMNSDHRKQISRYASLLRKMGYEDVRGYLWYLSVGEIVEVV